MTYFSRDHRQPPPPSEHEPGFASLHDPGQAIVVPCDARGQVDPDTLSQRRLVCYLGARAMLGLGARPMLDRDDAHPVIDLLH